MPRLSDTMEEGVLLDWLVEDGHEVNVGDPIADIETDKATMVLNAEEAGPLHRMAESGTSIAVGDRIGWIGNDVPVETEDRAPAAAANGQPKAEPEVAAPGRSEVSVAAKREATPSASPVARRLAADLGVDLDSIVGTGPGGRIGKKDVEAAARGGDVRADEPTPVTHPDRAESPPDTPVPLSRVQTLIADRMVTAQREIPSFGVEVDVRMDAATALRQALLETDERFKVSYNDMIVKACGLALGEHPKLNSSYASDRRIEHADVNVGIAVATADALVVPVVRQADKLSLVAIAAESRRLAFAVRDGKVAPADLESGTFTVSNLGMYGMHAITSIVNGPEVGILGVGALRTQLVRRDDEIVDESVCRLRLTCDHRVLYGADAALFLARVQELIERPLSLLAA